jgi:hypothetical protein
MLEHPSNPVMPIAPRALANDQLVNGDQPEALETAPVTALSAELEVQMPNLLEHGSASAATSLGVVGNGNQQVSASVAASSASDEPSSADVGRGMKQSSQSDSHLPPMEKRRKIQRSVLPRESGSEQVAETSANAIARATSTSKRPAVPTVGVVKMSLYLYHCMYKSYT